MSGQVANSDVMDVVFVSSHLIRAQRRARVQRMQRAIGLLVGFAAIGLGPYAISIFKSDHAAAHSHHAALYGSSIDAPASATDLSVVGTPSCIAAAQAAIGQTMARFHSEQDALGVQLNAGQLGASLFAGAPKLEPDMSALSQFILLDPLAMPFPKMTECVTTAKEPVS